MSKLNQQNATTGQVTPGTILSSISQDNIQHLRAVAVPRPLRSIFMYMLVYTAIIFFMILETYADNVWVTLLAIILIAGRQHSLYILNHDASHYGLFRSKRINKIVGSIFSNMTMFHHPEAWSFVQWRRVHILHHKYVLSAGDLNYVSRVNAGHTQKRLGLSEILSICIKTGVLSTYKFFTMKQDMVSPDLKTTSKSSLNHIKALFVKFKDDTEMERERRFKLVFFTMSLIGVAYFGLWWQFLILWILPMYTVYPMILVFMDLTEHRWHEDANNLYHNTRSIKYGFISKLFFSFLPRGLHLEHHVYQSVVAADLGKVNNVLRSQGLVTTISGLSGLIKDIASYSSEVEALQTAK